MNKRSGYRCAFKNCRSTTTKERGKKETLFRFPKDTERSKLWIAACARNDLLSKTSTELYRNYRICRLHFKRYMFLNYEQTRLQPHAIPNSTFRRNSEDEAESIQTQNVMDAILTEDTTIEVDTIDNLEKNTTMQGNTDTNKVLLDTPLSISSSTIGTQTVITSSSRATQTSLSLSARSPRKVHLHRAIQKYKKQVTALQVTHNGKDKEEDMNILFTQLEKFYPKEIANFMKEQACLLQNKRKGRKYSAAFKQHCLSLYFSSPRVYKDLINKGFCLPSCSTLKRFTRHCYIDAGLQDNIFKILKIKTESLQAIDRYCVMCIDEMSLKAHLFYNISRDGIIGLENIGCLGVENSTLLPACNVAVMMVKGICDSWKQPLSYFFLHSTMKASDLINIIQQAIRKLKSVNLNVVALITDMGSNFYKLSKLCNVNTEQPYIKVDEDKIFYF